MNIGIISINAHTKVLNFASPLHTFVFQQFLLDHGIDSTIIDYKPVYYGKFDVRHPLDYYLEHPDKNPKKQQRLVKRWTELYDDREYRFDRFEDFIDHHYIRTSECYDPWLLDEKDPGFDCYICVTDVIWKLNKNSGFDKGFFLACKAMDGKKKIAYAPSRGATTYNKVREREFLSYISDFDYLSAREDSFCDYMQGITGLDVPHVIDPVFLEDREFYEKLAIAPDEKHRPKKKFVLLYVVMEKNKDVVKKAVRYAEENDLDVIELSENYENADIPEGTHHKVFYDLGVEEWLWYLLNCESIFTNSFHACCFSIIFHKSFFAGARAGDKIDSLLRMFGLEWRRVKDDASLETVMNMPPVDFEEVDKLRYGYVKSSSDYILGAIQDLEQRDHKPLISGQEYESLMHKYDDAEEVVAKEEEQRAREAQRKAAAKELEKKKKARKKSLPYRALRKIKRMIIK